MKVAKAFPPVYLMPGDSTNVSDSEGNSIEVIAVESPAVLDLAEAFKEWLELTNMPMQVAEQTMNYTRRKLLKAFESLPDNIWKEIDRRSKDIIIPGGGG